MPDKLEPALLRRAAAHLRARDPVLAPIVARVGPCRFEVDARGTHFSALIEAMLYQQITGRAARAILARFRELIGRSYPRPRDILARSDAELRGAGLSRQKIAYFRDLARRCQDGLSFARLSRLPDEDVVEALTEVRGVGRWTAEMFLMFRLGRPDVLPVGDYGIRKAMQRAYRMRALPMPERMRRVAEPWRPYRSVASWYLWRSLGV